MTSVDEDACSVVGLLASVVVLVTGVDGLVLGTSRWSRMKAIAEQSWVTR